MCQQSKGLLITFNLQKLSFEINNLNWFYITKKHHYKTKYLRTNTFLIIQFNDEYNFFAIQKCSLEQPFDSSNPSSYKCFCNELTASLVIFWSLFNCLLKRQRYQLSFKVHKLLPNFINIMHWRAEMKVLTKWNVLVSFQIVFQNKNCQYGIFYGIEMDFWDLDQFSDYFWASSCQTNWVWSNFGEFSLLDFIDKRPTFWGWNWILDNFPASFKER